MATAGNCPPQPGQVRRPSIQARLLLGLFRRIIKPSMQKRIELPKAHKLVGRLDNWFGGRPKNFVRTQVLSCNPDAEWVTVRPGPSERVILYLHGGGFMFSMPAVHARLAARLCRMLDAAAFIPHYRCAPEHPLPAAHEDCFTAYRWLLAEGHDPARIVIIGDSAGGLLTLATLQRIRDSRLPAPLCGVMFSPGTCFDSIRDLDGQATANDPMIGAGMLDLLQRIVIEPTAVNDAAISPCAGSLHGLPPLLFQAGSTEMLLHQSVKAHAMASAAGTEAELQIWPEMPHVWQAVPWLPEAQHALDCVAEFVERHCRKRQEGTGKASPTWPKPGNKAEIAVSPAPTSGLDGAAPIIGNHHVGGDDDLHAPEQNRRLDSSRASMR